jgi:hypothetical protein
MYNEIAKLIPEYWQEFINTRVKKQCNKNGIRIIPVKSMPIIRLGNLDRYQNSQLKIVTVSINPHYRAFSEEAPHYDLGFLDQITQKVNLQMNDIYALTQQYDSYFKRNETLVYTDTVFKTYEFILNQFKASYLPNIDYHNQALHIDMLSPLATNPSWTKLKSQYPEIAQGLEHRGKKLFKKLITILNPDIILISLQRQSIIDVFEIDDTWRRIDYLKDTTKKNNTNAILYTNRFNQHILYGQYNLYGKERKVFGYASENEFLQLINDAKQIIIEEE